MLGDCKCLNEKERFYILNLVDESISKENQEIQKIISRKENAVNLKIRPHLKIRTDLESLKDSIRNIPICESSMPTPVVGVVGTIDIPIFNRKK